jgi:hypothetical protein
MCLSFGSAGECPINTRWMFAVGGEGNQNPRPAFYHPSAESKQNRRFHVVSPIPKDHVKIPSRNIKIILAGGSLKPTIVKCLA